MIERVAELEMHGKTHYLPHPVVIQKSTKTTKVRIVYSASSKEERKGVSLNDCLHVGSVQSPLPYDILGSRVGAMVKVLASHQCGPGSIPGLDVMWVEFVVGSLPCSERFFSGYSGFPLSPKTNISKFQFDPDAGPP